MKNKYFEFYEKKHLTFKEETISVDSIPGDCVAGKTIYSMISAGTEINGCYLDVFDSGYPKKSGYTAVFKVDYVGQNVEDIKIGDIVFAMGNHSSYQYHHFKNVLKVPENVLPQEALFIRMAGVPMATLSRTKVKPGDIVMVVGLGTVGLMAMQIYSNLGYTVIGVEMNPDRRKIAIDIGFKDVFESAPLDNGKYAKKVGLALECAGNEQAVFDCCKMVRPHGEVSLVGVPWKRLTDIPAFDILNAVFYNYVTIYSGWEMDLPINVSKFAHESMNKNYKLALKLISESKVNVDNLFTIKPYTQAQEAYDSIYNKTEIKLSTILDWKGVELND